MKRRSFLQSVIGGVTALFVGTKAKKGKTDLGEEIVDICISEGYVYVLLLNGETWKSSTIRIKESWELIETIPWAERFVVITEPDGNEILVVEGNGEFAGRSCIQSMQIA